MEFDISKNRLRQEVWSYMEEKNIALFPKPVYNRIPNYKGADEACLKVTELPEFKNAHSIKIDPDSPLQKMRYLTLLANKMLLVPTPQLKNGLLNKISPPPNATILDFETCSTYQGIINHSVKIDLNTKIKVDLVIVGAVALSTAGYRIGKGKGYSDMEFAMMAYLEAVNCDTTVICVVHDCQVYSSIPDHLFKEHDVPVDVIVTPTKVIRCQPRLKKPHNIFWHLLTEEQLRQIPVLRILKAIEDKKSKV